MRRSDGNGAARSQTARAAHKVNVTAETNGTPPTSQKDAPAGVRLRIHTERRSTSQQHITAVATIVVIGAATKASDQRYHATSLSAVLRLACSKQDVSAVGANRRIRLTRKTDAERDVSTSASQRISSAHGNMP